MLCLIVLFFVFCFLCFCVFVCLVVSSVGCLLGWLLLSSGWLLCLRVCLLVGWLVGWMDGWMVGWLVGELVNWLVGWCAAALTILQCSSHFAESWWRAGFLASLRG